MLRRAPQASRSQTGPVRSSALSQYDDYIEDVVSAPDICAANLVTNDNVAFTLGMHVHDRSAFAASDSYRVYLDTDSNPSTGAPADVSPLAGSEFLIDIGDQVSTLSAWDGAAFVPVTPQPEIPSGWAEGYGPVLQIDRSALGDPTALDLVLSTENGADHDRAPDLGSWSYVVTPLRLTAGRLVLGPGRAGRQLLAGMEVARSDFEIPLDEGSIACSASLAGKKLGGRGRFIDDLVVCVWRLPRGASGKRVSGSVSVTFQGVTAKRSFALRVR